MSIQACDTQSVGLITQTMMEKSVLVIGLQVFVFSVLMHTTEAGTERREDLIQDSVRRLLGVKPGFERPPLPGKTTTLPPRYVMDLYERYRSGRTPMQGNTVRSILPIRDTIGDADVLIFNLTGINSSEQILQSKLYLLKRRKPKIRKRREFSNFRIKIGNLPQMTSHRFIDVSLTRTRSEWHSYDITESVVQCRQSKKDGDHLLGVTLEIRRAKGFFRLAPFRRLLKHNSQPFVLIFSEDSNNQSRSSLRPNARNTTQSGIQDLLRSRVEHNVFVPEDYSNDQDISDEESFNGRRKRSPADSSFSTYNSSKTQRENEFLQKYLKYLLSFIKYGLFKKNYDFKLFQTSVEIHRNLRWSLSTVKMLRDLISETLNADANKLELEESSDDVHSKTIISEVFSDLYHNHNATNDFTSADAGIQKLSKVLLNKTLSLEELKYVLERTVQGTEEITLKRHQTKRATSTTSGSSTNQKQLHAAANTFHQTVDKKYAYGFNNIDLSSSRQRRQQRKWSSGKYKTNEDADMDVRLESHRAKRSIPTALGSSTNPKQPLVSANTLHETVHHKYERGFNSSKLSHRRHRQKDRLPGSRRPDQKQKRRHRKLPVWWTRHAKNLHSKDHQSMCQRRSFVVDFTKLGWGEWVMSPKSFNAYYCTGGCPFPLFKDTKPSNHAAIQSLVHTLGLNPGIPSPCCVPSVTSSLTLLYFDEYGSLVLKNYPDMIVEKCACR